MAAAVVDPPASQDDGGAVLLSNKQINFYDPPKDLHVGSFLNHKEHGHVLGPILKNMFNDGHVPLNGWTSVGDTKPALRSLIQVNYAALLNESNRANKIDIVRLSSSTGDDPRPHKLFVSQDCGPSDVVSNPTYVITPGVILDTAGKTKVGNQVNLVNEYPTLPGSYIHILGMDRVIDGGVTLNRNGDTYTLTMRLWPNPSDHSDNSVPFRAVFNANYDVVPAAILDPPNAAAYFEGNVVKNTWIAGHLNADNREEIQKFILIKLEGDTFQVQWLNYIFNQPGTARGGPPPILRNNTVVTTSDTVTWLRCLVNKVGVIFTDRHGKSTWYIPGFRDPSEINDIKRRLVSSVRDSVVKNNIAVITTIKKVRDAIPPNTGVFINGGTWDKAHLVVLQGFLHDLVTRLETRNREINSILTQITDLDQARTFARDNHFECPFMIRNNVYKTINSVKQISPEIKFKTTNINNGSFSSRERANQQIYPVAAGGGVQQGGHNITIILEAARLVLREALQEQGVDPMQVAAALAAIGAVGMAATLYTASHGPAAAEEEEAAAAAAAAAVGLPIPNPTHNINQELIEQSTRETGDLVDHRRNYNVDYSNRVWAENTRQVPNGFIYCYVREFIPEIFTYGYWMKTSCSFLILRGLPDKYRLRETVKEDFLTPTSCDPCYYYNERDVFQSVVNIPVTLDSSSTTRNYRFLGVNLNDLTHEYIQYAQLFTVLHPSMNTNILRDFFNRYGYYWSYIMRHRSYIIDPALLVRNLREDLPRDLRGGNPLKGGGSELDSMTDLEKISTLAMDLYHAHYRLEVMKSFEPVNIETCNLLKKIITVIDYIEILKETPSELLEKELEYFTKDLASIPAVAAKLQEKNEGSKVSPGSLGYRRRMSKKSIGWTKRIPIRGKRLGSTKRLPISSKSLELTSKPLGLTSKPLGWTRRLPYSSKSLGLTRRLPYSREPIRVRPEGGRRGRRTRKRQHKNRKTKKRV
jgi:hypothetical protein